MGKPKALLVAPIMPARQGNGLAMRVGLFLEAVAQVCETDLLVVPLAGRADAPDLPSQLGLDCRVIPVAGRHDTLFDLLMRVRDPSARLEAFRRYGRPSIATGLSIPVLDDVRRHVDGRRYDLIHISRSYLSDVMSVLPPPGAASLDLDEDEVRSQHDQAARAREGGRQHDADWACAEADAFAALVERTTSSVHNCFISSAADAKEMRARHHGLTLEIVENAVELPVGFTPRDDGNTALFVGSFGYWPNVDAMQWFAGEIWPEVRMSHAGARLVIVGRDAQREIQALHGQNGIEVLGAVENIGDAYAQASIVVAPLRAGAGTRLKLIEAAAHGVPAVATPLAARGLDGLSAAGWLAADAAEFAQLTVEALADPVERRARGRRAAVIASERYERRGAIASLARRFESLLKL